MKTLRLILAFLTLGIAISSCQKDISFEGGNAKGSLGKTTAGDCDPILVNGLYYKDTVMKASNFVDVQIDFTKIGIYNIKTDTVNGYSFVATGSTGTQGLNTVRLFGKGKPLAAGFNIFTVKFDGSQCSFTVSVTVVTGGGGGGGTGAAVFTFGGSPGTCTGSVLGGTYTSGVAMTPANNVTIPVTVTTAGTYNITTISDNGVIFSGTGSLSTAGAQTITLFAAGSPTAPLTANYPISSGTSNCSFGVTYLAAGSLAAFTFNCGPTGSSPVINGTYTVGVPTNGTNSLTLPITLLTPGSYNISITAVNGFGFSGSGNIPAGATSITLLATPSSEPNASAAPFTNFTITSGASNCMFTIPVASALYFNNGVSGPLKTFNFNAGAINGSATPLPGFKLEVGGDATNSPTNPESFTFTINKATAFAAAATYNVNSLATGIIMDVTYTNSTGTDFAITSAVTPQTPGFNIVITSLTATRVVGTFDGTLKDGMGNPFVITGGNFNLPL
jgi:hypothetical protein